MSVERFWNKLPDLRGEQDVVLASDYDALAAEHAKLQESLRYEQNDTEYSKRLAGLESDNKRLTAERDAWQSKAVAEMVAYESKVKALADELAKARCALGAIYGTGERTVTEGIELVLSDLRAEKHHTTKLIMDNGALTDELDKLKKQKRPFENGNDVIESQVKRIQELEVKLHGWFAEKARLEGICERLEKCVAEGLTKEEAERLRAERDKLKSELDWQNNRNSGTPTMGGFEFYINEEWTGLAAAALDADAGWHAALRKHRIDPDDERVRVRRVVEDDALLAKIAALQAEAGKLSEEAGNRMLKKLGVKHNELFEEALDRVIAERDNESVANLANMIELGKLAGATENESVPDAIRRLVEWHNLAKLAVAIARREALPADATELDDNPVNCVSVLVKRLDAAWCTGLKDAEDIVRAMQGQGSLSMEVAIRHKRETGQRLYA